MVPANEYRAMPLEARPGSVRLTFFHSAAACLHVPAKLTPETAKHEARKRRANERHVVGCCEVLGRSYNEDRTWHDAGDSMIDLRQQCPKTSQRCVKGLDRYYTDFKLFDVLLIA